MPVSTADPCPRASRPIALLTSATIVATMLLTLLGHPGVADAAPTASRSASTSTSSSAAARTSSVHIRNASFTYGSRAWKIFGRGTHVSSSHLGHGDHRALSVRVPSHRAGGVRQLGFPDRAARAGIVRTSAWVHSVTPRSHVRLRVMAARHGKMITVATREYDVKRNGWKRLSLTARKRVARGTRLTVAVVVTSLVPQTTTLVDDVQMTVTGASTGNGAGTTHGTSGTGSTSTPPSQLGPDGVTWLSGASGDGVADGTFGTWRGLPATIAGTWADTDAENQVNAWSLRPGFEYANWDAAIDVAIGAIYENNGETWAAAAKGAYDARWTAALQNLATERADRPGTTYIRFAHEFNGDWEPWAVTGATAGDFKKAWDRFRALQQQIFPTAKLVFCPNSETSADLDLDWRQAFPGKNEVDVMSVDFYNQFPYVGDVQSFNKALVATDSTGAPRGLEAHREYAAAVGLPFAISEWSSNSDMGDGSVFVTRFRQWLAEHAGTGPGQVLYEIEFNVSQYDNGKFELFPVTHQPQASAAYRRMW